MATRASAGRERAALLVAGMAYALGAAATKPFSLAANVMTGIPIALLAALAIARWPLRPQPVPAPGRHPYRDWIIFVVVFVVWELADYAARGSRAAHPTLSSMVDAVDRYYVLKALLFFAWLCVCAFVVRAGTARSDA